MSRLAARQGAGQARGSKGRPFDESDLDVEVAIAAHLLGMAVVAAFVMALTAVIAALCVGA